MGVRLSSLTGNAYRSTPDLEQVTTTVTDESVIVVLSKRVVEVKDPNNPDNFDYFDNPDEQWSSNLDSNTFWSKKLELLQKCKLAECEEKNQKTRTISEIRHNGFKHISNHF
jgi:hypothetical protein